MVKGVEYRLSHKLQRHEVLVLDQLLTGREILVESTPLSGPGLYTQPEEPACDGAEGSIVQSLVYWEDGQTSPCCLPRD